MENKRNESATPTNVSIAILVNQHLVNGQAVWQPKTTYAMFPTGTKHKDVMYATDIALAGLFTNQIVPYPSNPYEEYTLSNCVVFTMTLSKALRKTHAEIEEARDPTLVTNETEKKVWCYGDWGACPYHMAHCQVPEAVLKWRSICVSWHCSTFIFRISQFGDVAVLNSVFSELLRNEESPSDLQSSIVKLRTRCMSGACRGGEKSLVKWLITLGTDVNGADNRDGKTALYYACERGHVEIVKILKNIPGIDVNKASGNGLLGIWRRPFWCACSEGHVDIVKILKEVPGIDLNTANDCGMAPFFQALCNRRVGILTILKDIPGVDVNKADNGGTSFSYACKWGSVEIVKFLKDIPGIDVNKADNEGRTPFWYACSECHTDVLEILKDIPGIDVNKADNEGRTPFWWVCDRGHVDIVKILKDAPGIDANKADNYGSTPFSTACKWGHVEIVKILKDIPGIDVNETDNFGGTGFQLARRWHRNEVLAILQDISGIDVNGEEI